MQTAILDRFRFSGGILSLNRKVPIGSILRQPSARGMEPESFTMGRLMDRHGRIIEAELQNILRYILQGGTSSAMLARIDSLPREGLVLALREMLLEAGIAGVGHADEVLRIGGMRVPVPYAENLIAQWAQRYDYRLIQGIDHNSRFYARHHVREWALDGKPLSDLEDRLTPWFGRTRAEMIASTEATRAYTEGTFTGWEAAGFNRRPIESNRPPAHPRCRCFPALSPDPEPRSEQWVYVWYTVNDEHVCPICEPKHLDIIGVAGTPNYLE